MFTGSQNDALKQTTTKNVYTGFMHMVTNGFPGLQTKMSLTKHFVKSQCIHEKVRKRRI